ncbi:MAG: DUF3343 domain-containing protein [Clostridia bacterium]|nr:DUF3343 domain-containing protein [Clostridia bacterium]
MDNILIVFRARSETMNFAMLAKSYGINYQIVNTPRIINVSCGISVKINFAYIEKAKDILKRRSFSTFAGVYKIEQEGLRQKAVRIG